MSTCETCKFWTRQPDYVFQPTEWQKPVGPPHVTRFGVCSKLEIGFITPASDDMLGSDDIRCERDTITTGIKFGCIHHS